MAETVSTYSQIVVADGARRSLEFLLAPYLTKGANRADHLSESDLRQISTDLRRMGKDSWSKVPRIYAVLQMIDHVQVIDSFLTGGVTDAWFPFSAQTLPESLRSPSARHSFLKLQDVVLTKSLDLEREDGRHRHFSKSEDVPLQKVEELGKGGFGYVDRVISTITYKEYARKLIPRGRTFKKNAQVLRDFERELGHLKKLSHAHVVKLIGSYTDPKFVGIIMSPVADSNLMDFLDREFLSSGDRSFLRTFFGCLAAALCYLHENKIRHKDIKPQNVLVKDHQVFLTDFGISLDWSELDQSTTTGVTIKTPRYCAPEVANSLPRNSLSDLWSLGCVFLEIWTVLKGENIGALYQYLELHGSKSTCYYLNCDSSLEWCRLLEEKIGNAEENPALPWIRGMLQLHQDKRMTAQTLVDRIQEANDNPYYRYSFSGLCCIDRDDSTVSGHSSRRSSIFLEKTGRFPAGVYNGGSGTAEDEADAELEEPNLSSSLTIRPLKVLNSDKATLRNVPVVREVGVLGHEQFQGRLENRASSECTISANDTSSKFLITSPTTRRKMTYYLGQLQGHGGWVMSVAFSPDGTTIASGSRDRSVRTWDAATGRPLRELEGHGDGVISLAFSPDGTTIASGSEDRSVRTWDAATGRPLRELEGHGDGVYSVAFSPDGTTIASGSLDRSVRTWDAATGRPLRELKGHGDWVYSVAFSPDGTTIASSSEDWSVRTWDAATGRPLRKLEDHKGGVYSVAFSPDGTTIASGSGDRSVRTWDAATGRPLRELEGHGDWVYSVAFSPDGTTIASGSLDRSVRTWDAATGRPLRELEGHGDWVFSVAFSPDGTTIASGSEDKSVRTWDAHAGCAIV